jgi:hypothetical protein
MSTILKYALYFILVFALFMGIAVVAIVHTVGALNLPVGIWVSYDADIPSIKVFNTAIGWRDLHDKLYLTTGWWKDRTFYAKRPSGVVIAARELPNEDLEVHLAGFVDGDPHVFTAVKAVRMPYEHYPFPILRKDQHVSYPPPRGLIRIGMLEADLRVLPWQPITREESPIYSGDREAKYFGTHLQNGWPTIWRYRSDNPVLPELSVTVTKGRITAVSGGAEETNEPLWQSPRDGSNNIGDTFLQRCMRPIIEIVFGTPSQ